MRGILILFILITHNGLAQQELFPILNQPVNKVSQALYQSDNLKVHTSIQPYNYNSIKEYVSTNDSTSQNRFDKQKTQFRKGVKNIFIAPVADAYGGINTTNGNQNYFTGLGIISQYNFSSKLGIGFTYRYINAQLKKYVDTSLYTKNVIPSTGVRTSILNHNNNETQDFRGYISYTPNSIFSFLLGRGQHFWGDGYRSLYLSDNASPYPYFRIESTFWKVKYTNLYAWHQDISTGKTKNKFSASHHLSWNIIPEFNLGIFETVVWAGNDTLVNRGFDVNYLNPVVFYRPVEYAQGSTDNSIIGFNFKAKLKKEHILYGQLVLDEFLLAEIKSGRNWWGNKYAIQIGYKNYNFLNIKNLTFLIERNIVRPYTYSHISSAINYGHLNQSLAHPLGANFKETVILSSYRYKKLNFTFQTNFTTLGADTSSVSMGNDIFKSYANRNQDYGIKFFQGEKHHIIYNKIKVSYPLIKSIQMQAFTSLTVRNELTPNHSQTDVFIQAGITTRLWNRYTDY